MYTINNIERLRLTTKPQDVLINHFGESVQFKCTSSNEQIIPYWLFNGQPKITGIGKSMFLLFYIFVESIFTSESK